MKLCQAPSIFANRQPLTEPFAYGTTLKNGDPNDSDLPARPVSTKDSAKVMVLGKDIHTYRECCKCGEDGTLDASFIGNITSETQSEHLAKQFKQQT